MLIEKKHTVNPQPLMTVNPTYAHPSIRLGAGHELTEPGTQRPDAVELLAVDHTVNRLGDLQTRRSRRDGVQVTLRHCR